MNRTKCRVARVIAAGIIGATGLLFPSAHGDEMVLSRGCLCRDAVGNINCDYADLVTLGDVALLVDHLFISGVHLPNLEEANASGDAEGVIDTADVAILLDHLFISQKALPDCL